MKRDYRDYLTDIVNSIDHIEQFIKDQNYEDFFEDIKTSNAVIEVLK